MGVNAAGFQALYNGVVWYISAMLIVMLPMCYLLIKNKDFFIYVLSPLAALLSFGYLYQYDNKARLVQAISGLCFGVVAWAIHNKLCAVPDNKVYRIMITLGELLTGGLFFYTLLFNLYSKTTLYCAALLLPIMIAIEFSNKSCISHLFKFKWMKHCGTLSLMIYLNHSIGVMISNSIWHDRSYWFRLAVVVVLTAVFSVTNFVAVKIIKAVWNKIMSVG